jgi:hypothetical protein
VYRCVHDVCMYTRMYVCMHVFMCVGAHTSMYACMHVRTCICTCTCAHISAYAQASRECARMSEICVCMLLRVRVHAFVEVFAHLYAYTNHMCRVLCVCMYIRTHVYF